MSEHKLTPSGRSHAPIFKGLCRCPDSCEYPCGNRSGLKDSEHDRLCLDHGCVEREIPGTDAWAARLPVPTTRRIYKYVLSPDTSGRCVVPMVTGARPLHVAAQGDDLCLWAKVDTQHDEAVEHVFHVYGTGHELRDEPWQLSYVGTALMHNGALVWHVFEELPIETDLNRG